MSSSEDSASSEEIDIEALRNAPAFLSESSDDNAEQPTGQANQSGVATGTPEARPIPVLTRPGPLEPDFPPLDERAEERSEDGVTLYLTPLNPDGSYRADDEDLDYTPPCTPPERRYRPRSPTPVRSRDPEFGRLTLNEPSLRATLPPFPDPSRFDFNVLRNARPIRPSLNFRPRSSSGLTRFSFPTPAPTPTMTPRSEGVTLMLTPLNPDGTPRSSSDEDNNTPPQTNRDRPGSPTPTPSGDRARPAYPGLLRARDFVRPTQANILNAARLPSLPRRGYYDTPAPSRSPRPAGFNFATPTQTPIVTPRMAAPRPTPVRYDLNNIPPGSTIFRSRHVTFLSSPVGYTGRSFIGTLLNPDGTVIQQEEEEENPQHNWTRMYVEPAGTRPWMFGPPGTRPAAISYELPPPRFAWPLRPMPPATESSTTSTTTTATTTTTTMTRSRNAMIQSLQNNANFRARVYYAQRGRAFGPRVRGGRFVIPANFHTNCNCGLCD